MALTVSGEPVPLGYCGNLTQEQEISLARFKEAILEFAQRREAEASSISSGSEIAAPTAPIKLGTPAEEAAEARVLAASDRDLLRFLRARDFDYRKSLDLALGACEWRASVKPEQVVPEMLPNALPSKLWRFAGYAKSGMPILLIDAANWVPSSYYGVDEYVRYVAYITEVTMAQMGPGVERIFALFQLAGFSVEMMRPLATRCLIELARIVQYKFPERLGAAMLLNAPPMFSLCWRWLSRIMDPRTHAKVHFVSRDAVHETLRRYIDEDQLSVHLGGKHEEHRAPVNSVRDEIREFLESRGGVQNLPRARDITALTGLTHAAASEMATKGRINGAAATAGGGKALEAQRRHSDADSGAGSAKSGAAAAATFAAGPATAPPQQQHAAPPAAPSPPRRAAAAEGVAAAGRRLRGESGTRGDDIFGMEPEVEELAAREYYISCTCRCGPV